MTTDKYCISTIDNTEEQRFMITPTPEESDGIISDEEECSRQDY